uniref:Uncharacterized protein n=1 Tax=viral metagenome TaxID=1070528 RepID=A0A6M3K8G1_9ZZZZ
MVPEIKTLFQLYGKDKILKKVLEATEKLRKAVKVKEDTVKLSAKAQKLKERCISFGPSGPKWAAIISDIIEEDIMIKDMNTSYPFIKFAAIVPQSKYESHGYAPGRILFMVLVTGDKDFPDFVKGIKSDGTFGGNIRPVQRFCVIPSDEFIKDAVSAIFATLRDDKIDLF